MVARPHGNKLVDRVARGAARERLLKEAQEMPRIVVGGMLASDVENIAHGVYSPLEGFMTRDEYFTVLLDKRLPDDTPWTIPIVLDVRREEVKGVKEGDEVCLWHQGIPLAVLSVEDVYTWNKEEFAEHVFGYRDSEHPGVRLTYARGEVLIGGKVTLLNDLREPFESVRLWPKETRVLFSERGWRRIVAFQTRNVPHLGHEYVQKAALTFADGLFINPLVGWKKKGDYRDEVIVEAYKVLIERYYPRDSVVLSVLRTRMWYAGPREAIHHAIMRKNFGATHIIVGRDHAGVGNYYGPYDAWRIFEEFPDLGITPLFIREAFYCKQCGGMANEKICPHPPENRISISGTAIREAIKRGERPPDTMMRPEVADAILRHPSPFIEVEELG
ncbi:MAG: sulfate adenylyltransferase [Infirmifilum sp.]